MSTDSPPVFYNHYNHTVVINQILNQGVIHIAEKSNEADKKIPKETRSAECQQPERQMSALCQDEVISSGNGYVLSKSGSSPIGADKKESSEILSQTVVCSSNDSHSRRDSQIEVVTSILKSMENDLKELIEKEKVITETVNQLTNSNAPVKSVSQVQDLHEQVESNEKMLEKVSTEFGRLKQFSRSMSEMVQPKDSIPQKVPSLEEVVIEPVIGQLKFQKKVVEWTSMCNYRILYRSITDGLSARSLNGRICGKSNILLIVVTDANYIFGSFSSVQIPLAPRLGDLHVGADPNFFVYSFENPFKTEPLKITKKNTNTSLKIYSNKEQSYVIGCDCCFYIRSNCPSHIPTNFCDNYNDISTKGNVLFTNTVYPDKFNLHELIAVELSY